MAISLPLFSEWHSWDELPKEGELYMYVEVNPCGKVYDRQILHLQRYSDRGIKYQHVENGWWDVTKESVWDWLNQGSKLIYDPR